MSIGVNGLLSTGQNALLGAQVGINVTSNNVANANTPGYVRQSVIYEELPSIDYHPGQIGTGSYAQQVVRDFDRFLENSFLDQNSQANKWSEQAAVLSTVEGYFNEANSAGLHSQMSEFFNTWSTLSTTPDSIATREDLISQTQNLTALMRDMQNSLERTQSEMDSYINNTVDAVNSIVDQIADINIQIAQVHNPPYTNANSLLDQRDSLVRELGTYVDVSVQESDNGRNFSVYLKEGTPLVEDGTSYHLTNSGPYYENDTEAFTGELLFEGEDTNEYTLDFVSHNEFRVSIDGGKTWVADEYGQSTFQVPPVGEKTTVGNLTVSFEGEDYATGTTPSFAVGDQFVVIPKDNIKWHKPTRDPLDVSSTVNEQSIGGKLGAYIEVRDSAISDYQTQLDALAETLIWEINRLHSQGSGTEGHTQIVGNVQLQDLDLALGSPFQSLPFSDRLTEGNLNISFYDSGTEEPLLNTNLNFNADPTGPTQNFDPEVHTLSDVVDAINRSFIDDDGNSLMTASIVSGQIQLTAATGVNFQMGSDTTGLWAALGVNTFFEGNDAFDININSYLVDNPQHVAAHSVDGQDQANAGDGLIASMIAKLSTEPIEIQTTFGSKTLNIMEYYAGLVGEVGADTRNALYNSDYYGTLSNEVANQVASKTGVNLDEEMTLLIKYQHSYTSAAKLITTADEMFQTLLGMKV